MVHILLVILKFIGILLASILGLLLLFLLIILLAPLGYQAAGEAGAGKNRFQANISWLYVVLRGKIVYDEEGIHWYVRLFGILFASSDEEFQKKRAAKAEKRKKKKAEKIAAKKKKKADKKKTAEKKKKETTKIKKEEKVKIEQKKTEIEDRKALESEKEADVKRIPVQQEKMQPESCTENEKESEKVTESEEKPEKQIELEEKLEKQIELEGKPEKQIESEGKPEKKIESEKKYLQSDQSEEPKESTEVEKDWKTSWMTAWNSLLEKLLKTKKRATDFYTKWKNRLLSIPKKIHSIRQSLDDKLEKLEMMKEFWRREETQDVKNRLIRDGKKVLIHILPRRFRGHIEFGLEDPYLMGQILAVLGMLMPLYQDKLTVVPDFEEPKLIGSFYLKGRIIPGYLFIKGVALLLNKNVRKTIKEGKQLIGGN